MTGPTPRRDENGVKSYRGVGKLGIGAQIRLCRPDDPATLAAADRVCRAIKIGTKFDLDNRNKRTPSGDDIDLTHRNPIIRLEDAISFQAEPPSGHQFGPPPEFLCLVIVTRRHLATPAAR